MAIADVKEYCHLTEEEVEQLGRELDALRTEVEESRGAADAAYINRIIRIQRGLAFAGRVTLLLSNRKPAWAAGTAMLGIATLPPSATPCVVPTVFSGASLAPLMMTVSDVVAVEPLLSRTV